MSISFKSNQKGLIDTIVLIVIALVILGYFNIDLKQIFSEPLVSGNLKYALQLIIEGVQYVWNILQSFIGPLLNR
jgi:hypothetical protein